MKDVTIGILIGVGLSIMLIGILNFLYHLIIGLITLCIDVYDDQAYLRKRNKHRVKCGLPKIKKQFN